MQKYIFFLKEINIVPVCFWSPSLTDLLLLTLFRHQRIHQPAAPLVRRRGGGGEPAAAAEADEDPGVGEQDEGSGAGTGAAEGEEEGSAAEMEGPPHEEGLLQSQAEEAG